MRQMIRLFIVTVRSFETLYDRFIYCFVCWPTANMRGRKFNAFPLRLYYYILGKRVVYNYKSNISTHLIDINTNL